MRSCGRVTSSSASARPRRVRKAELLIGPLVEERVESLSPGIEYRDLLVLNRRVAGTLRGRACPAPVGHPVIVSRIRRGGVQITPHPETAPRVRRPDPHGDAHGLLDRGDPGSSAIR